MQTRPLRHFDASLGRSVVSGDVMDAFENTHTERRAELRRANTAIGVGIFKRILASPETTERPNKKQNGVFAQSLFNNGENIKFILCFRT